MLRKLLKKIFKIHSHSKEWTNIRTEYVEKDTKCDNCEYLMQCEDCIECTKVYDTRRHYIPMLGGECKLQNEKNRAAFIAELEKTLGFKLSPEQLEFIDNWKSMPSGVMATFGADGKMHYAEMKSCEGQLEIPDWLKKGEK